MFVEDSAQKDFTHHMRMRIILFTALPASSDAFRATQKLQQRDTIFAAKIHKLDMLYSVIEKHSCGKEKIYVNKTFQFSAKTLSNNFLSNQSTI